MDKSERRQQILTRAREVFANRGYHAAKIDEIVAAAGVARGTFYLYFEDKRAIFEEIVDQAFVAIGNVIEHVDTDDPSRSVVEQVRANARRVVHLLLSEPGTTKILLNDAVGLDPELDRKLASFYEQVIGLLESSLADGQERGIVGPGNTRLLAVLTIGALKEMLFQVVTRGLSYPEEAIVDAIYDFLRAGYLRIER